MPDHLGLGARRAAGTIRDARQRLCQRSSSRGRRRPSATATGSTSSRRSREGENDGVLGRDEEGPVRARRRRRRGFEVTARAFPGQSVEYAMRDPRTGRYLASVTSWFYGGRIWVADDPAGEWQEAEGIALPEDGDASLARIWVIAPGEADGAALRRRRSRAACSRATTAGSRGRSTAASGITRRGPTGARAAAGSACTRSSRGPATPTG